jgi:hypothetical protein
MTPETIGTERVTSPCNDIIMAPVLFNEATPFCVHPLSVEEFDDTALKGIGHVLGPFFGVQGRILVDIMGQVMHDP